jgi:hypothetical protein
MGTQSVRVIWLIQRARRVLRTGRLAYGDTMDARQTSDYDLIEPGYEQATAALDEAQRFVDRIVRFLQEQGYDPTPGMADSK